MANPLPSWDSAGVADLREFAAIRLVVADLDGSLVEPSSSELHELLESMRRKEPYRRRTSAVLFTIATGRTFSGIERILRDLHLPDGTPIILYNGSVVVRTGENPAIQKKTISEHAVQQLVAAAQISGIPLITYSLMDDKNDNLSLYDGIPELVHGWALRPPYEREFNGMHIIWERPEQLVEPPLPSAVLFDVESVENKNVLLLLDRLRLIDGISATQSGLRYIEIRPSGNNKGTTLADVAFSLGLRRSQVLAIGDADNDAEMLAWAGIGVAVASASLGALKAADYICRFGAAAGAAQVLRLIKDANRFYRI